MSDVDLDFFRQLAQLHVSRDLEADKNSAAKNELLSGWKNYQATLGETGSALGLNIDDWVARKKAESDVYQRAAAEQGVPQSWKEVQGPLGYLQYTGHLAASSLPFMGEAVLGGLTGGETLAPRLLGATAREANLLKGAARVAALERAPGIAKEIQTAREIAGQTGSVIASYPSSVGDILGNQREQAGKVDPTSAFALGIPYAVANAFGTEGAIARGRFSRIPIEAAEEMRGIKGRLARGFTSGLATAPGEGANELFQEVMNQAGRTFVDPNASMISPDAMDRYQESLIGGLVLGHASGQVAGAFTSPKNLLPTANPPRPTSTNFGQGTDMPMRPMNPAGDFNQQMGLPFGPSFEPTMRPNPQVSMTNAEQTVPTGRPLGDLVGYPSVGASAPSAGFTPAGPTVRIGLPKRVDEEGKTVVAPVGNTVAAPASAGTTAANTTEAAKPAALTEDDLAPIYAKYGKPEPFINPETGKQDGWMFLGKQWTSSQKKLLDNRLAELHAADSKKSEATLRAEQALVDAMNGLREQAEKEDLGERIARFTPGPHLFSEKNRISSLARNAEDLDTIRGRIRAAMDNPNGTQRVSGMTREIYNAWLTELSKENVHPTEQKAVEKVGEQPATVAPNERPAEMGDAALGRQFSVETEQVRQKIEDVFNDAFGPQRGPILMNALMYQHGPNQLARNHGVTVDQAKSLVYGYAVNTPRPSPKFMHELQAGMARQGISAEEFQSMLQQVVDEQHANEVAQHTQQEEGKKPTMGDGVDQSELYDNEESGTTAGMHEVDSVGQSKSNIGTGKGEGESEDQLNAQYVKAAEKGDKKEMDRLEALIRDKDKKRVNKAEAESKKGSKEKGEMEAAAEKWDSVEDPSGLRPTWDDLEPEEKAAWLDAVQEGRDGLIDQQRILSGDYGGKRSFESRVGGPTLIHQLDGSSVPTSIKTTWQELTKSLVHFAEIHKQLSDLGLSHVIDKIAAWTLDANVDYGAQIRYMPNGERHISINQEIVQKARNNPGLAWALRYSVRHELMHALDLADVNNKLTARYSDAPEMAWKDGAVVEELRKLWLKNVEGIKQLLDYPFKELQGEGTGLKQKELFAVVAGMASTKENLEMFSSIAPTTAKFLERVFQHAKETENAAEGSAAWNSFFRQDANGSHSGSGALRAGFEQVERVKPGEGRQFAVSNLFKRKSDAGKVEQPNNDEEVRKVKPAANVTRLAQLLGPQLYGNMQDMGKVALKEVFQNSFDALKDVIDRAGKNGTNPVKNPRIDITTNDRDRTIHIKDNGSGMTPEIVQKAFLTLAGTGKDNTRSSGGFGIAKMQFLFGSEKLDLVTVRDGVQTELHTTGKELMEALDTEGGGVDVKTSKTNKPNGTELTLKIPKDFVDPGTGETKKIDFPANYAVEFQSVFDRSPLFENIAVSVNGNQLDIGKNFPASNFTTFANVKFPWGNARIIVSKKETQGNLFGHNVHVLSNGLWQFSNEIKKDLMSPYGENLPRQIYINIEPKVKPTEAGYPFALNRQGYNAAVKNEIEQVYMYLWQKYKADDLAEHAAGYGAVHYVDKNGNLKNSMNLTPDISGMKRQGMNIDEGDKVEVVDGKLIVNGQEAPVLSPKDIKENRLKLEEFQVDQNKVDPDNVMLHDNMAFKSGQSVVDYMTNKFGPRFGKFVNDVGSTFMQLRDDLRVLGGSAYDGLEKIGVGVGFDKEWYGVHTKLPFQAMFINPMITKLDNLGPRAQAATMVGTMVHEIAHFAEMNHSTDFIGEMQRLLALIESRENGPDLGAYRDRLQAALVKYKDVFDELQRLGKNEDVENRGKRLGDGSSYDAPGSKTVTSSVENAEQRSGIQRAGGPRTSVVAEGSVGNASRNADQKSGITDRLPERLREPARTVSTTLQEAGKKAVYSLAFGHDLADMAKRLLPSAKRFMDLLGERDAVRQRYGVEVQHIAQLANTLSGDEYKTVNEVIRDATMEGKWPYRPAWAKADWKEKVDTDMEKRFNALSDKQKDIIRRVFQYGYDTRVQEKALLEQRINDQFSKLIGKETNDKRIAVLKDERDSLINDIKTAWMPGPYAPVMRDGSYATVAKSDAYLAAEEKNNTVALRKMASDPKHYYVAFSPSLAEAQRIKAELDKSGNYGKDGVEAFEKEHYYRDINQMKWKVLERIQEAADTEVEGLNPEDPSQAKMISVRRAIAKAISDLYLNSLRENDARQNSRERMKVAGFDQDMLNSFVRNGKARAYYLSALTKDREVGEAISAMRNDAHKRGPDRNERMQLLNEFLGRHAAMMQYNDNPWPGRLMGVTSLWMLLTSPAYHLTNATQPFMFTLPALAGRFGYGRSFAELMGASQNDAWKVVKDSTHWNNFDGIFNPDAHKSRVGNENAMLAALRDQNIIDIGIDQDLGEGAMVGNSNASKAFERAGHIMRAASRKVELANRVSTALAAYRLSYEEAKTAGKSDAQAHEAATAYARDMVRQTQGDYSANNAPRAFMGPWRKMFLQFRKYQIIQLSLLTRMMHMAFKGESADVRAIGRKQFAFLLAHHGVLAGALGLPASNLVAMMLNAAFGDPGDDDERYLRKLIGNQQIADLLLKGVPAALGVDISNRIGMNNTFSLTPFANKAPWEGRDGYKDTLMNLAGPFLGGLMPRVADGLAYMQQGDYYKGLESMSPTGIANLMKSYRYSTEGVTNKKGDVQVRPEDIDTVDAAMQAMGLPTQPITRPQQERFSEQNMEQALKDKASKITLAYTRAQKQGNTEAMAAARDSWNELQQARVAQGLQRAPMSDLLKAVQQQRQRELQTTKGVPYNSKSRNAVQQTTSI